MKQENTPILSLSDNTINQIAAGEVIENYSSMIKELIENSIDAKSKNISIYFSGENLESIQIIDDGIGMTKENLAVCHKRYFTSKISNIQDLQKISTMGFRGEALSSIASVSQLTIETRYKDQEHSYKSQINYGKEEDFTPSHRQQGTTLTVCHLFKKVPVRRKFLATPSMELKKCLRIIKQISFSHLDISFKIYNKNKNILNLSSSDLKKRLESILEKNFSENLIAVNQTEGNYHIEGLIGSFDIQKNTQENQFLYVNKRIVSSNLISKAFRNAYYESYKMKFPIGVLFLTCPTDLIDINIHPSKKQIKFLESQKLSEMIETSIQKTLIQKLKIPHFQITEKSNLPSIKSQIDFKINSTSQENISPPQTDFFKIENVKTTVKTTNDIENNSTNQPKKKQSSLQKSLSNPNKVSFTYLYLNQKLILLEIEGALAIIHQKRAHERILYEQALESLQNKTISTQQLLFPELLDLNKIETEVLQSNLKHFENLGFNIIEFGPLSFQIKGIPIQIQQNSAIEILKKMIHDFEINNKKEQNTFTILAQLYAKYASISYKKKLNHEEVIHLIDHLFSTQNPFISPQGKQTILRYSLDEIEQKFK